MSSEPQQKHKQRAAPRPHQMLPVAKHEELLKLYDLADRKGFDVTQSTMRDHIRLIDQDGNLVKNKNGGAAHSYAEARRYLGALPDQ